MVDTSTMPKPFQDAFAAVAAAHKTWVTLTGNVLAAKQALSAEMKSLQQVIAAGFPDPPEPIPAPAVDPFPKP